MSDDTTTASPYSLPAAEEDLVRTAAALGDRGIAAEICDIAEDARQRVVGMVPPEETVFTAVSDTLKTSGIADDLDASGSYRSIRAQLQGLDPLSAEARRLGAAPDVVVGSVQAITHDGRIVVVSATGSQLGPYAAGAGRAIWVVGAQKVVPDLETAMDRVETHCLPLESERCLQVYGRPSRIYKRLIIERDIPGRSTVILVREAIGF